MSRCVKPRSDSAPPPIRVAPYLANYESVTRGAKQLDEGLPPTTWRYAIVVDIDYEIKSGNVTPAIRNRSSRSSTSAAGEARPHNHLLWDDFFGGLRRRR